MKRSKPVMDLPELLRRSIASESESNERWHSISSDAGCTSSVADEKKYQIISHALRQTIPECSKLCPVDDEPRYSSSPDTICSVNEEFSCYNEMSYNDDYYFEENERKIKKQCHSNICEFGINYKYVSNIQKTKGLKSIILKASILDKVSLEKVQHVIANRVKNKVKIVY